jgi:CcmD family protein
MSKRFLILFALVAAALPAEVLAQTNLGAQQLGRGYWHVFAAYAIVWVLVFGWMVRIGRQLARVEQRLDAGEG